MDVCHCFGLLSEFGKGCSLKMNEKGITPLIYGRTDEDVVAIMGFVSQSKKNIYKI